MPMPSNHTIASGIFGIYRLLTISCVLLTIYFAQTIVIPLTVAALLTFLLSPIVTTLEKWIGRVVSILLVVMIVFSIIGSAGYIFTRQLILFGSNFPAYYETIQTKFEKFHLPPGGFFDRIGHSVIKLKDELLGRTLPTDQDVNVSPSEVKLIDLSSNFTHLIESVFGSFFNFLAMTGIVLLLVIFMLLNREDLRGRVIKLLGQGKISSTTNVMNDTSERVYRYLFRFFIVNVGYGICVSIGLYLIGIPNVILWGCFAATLRFIPYIGPWIAAIIPIALSFIITDTWSTPLLTLSFFILLEITTAYAIEPFYYGSGTGVSSFALIVAAISWTWLWGPIGLLLSTPLTVCLVVIGQHMTNMSFLRVLLSQEQALTPAEECYHRLLSFDSSESLDVIETYLQKNSLVSLYDSVVIPIITQTETDFHTELIDAEKKAHVYQSIREIVEFLNNSDQKEVRSPSGLGNILCIPSQAIRDELGASILTQVLHFEAIEADHSIKLNFNEVLELIEKRNADALCITAVAPFILSQMRFLCTKLHQKKPQIPLVLCLFGFPEPSSDLLEKLFSAGASQIVFNLSQTLKVLQQNKDAERPAR